MCGIAGMFDSSGVREEEIAVVNQMNKVQIHRGPDDEGLFYDDACVLGHRRLSIIDLSKDGHQPFFSEDGRYILVYNGEIYNYVELREELKKAGWQFRTKTDTEVLLKCYQHFKENCLGKLNGMFAFVVYDKEQKSLFLARDRVGIKPLYYVFDDNRLYFASEIKALRSIPGLSFSVNHQSFFDYLTFNRTDVFDETFLNEIKRLPKGHYAKFEKERFEIYQWWNPQEFLQQKTHLSLQAIHDRIEEILVTAVQLRMRSDVPIGSCLSGGLDSSIITGILFSHHNIKGNYSTFTSSFPGHPVDETSYIDILNKKYPFVNHRTFPSAESAFKELESFVYMNDEPTTSSSFYSQYEVMRLAKKKGVTVLLDGQGGDEIFAGYQYFHGFYLYGLLRSMRLLNFFRELLQITLRSQDRSAYQSFVFQMLPPNQKKRLLYQRLPFINKDFFYEYVDSSRIFNEFFDAPDLNTSLVRHFQYKLEHLLRMEDRNSMAFSLEARVPYLDHRLIEFLLSLPENLKIKKGETKYLQKQAVGKYTIPEILNRKDKIGFGTPRDEWMQTQEWQSSTKDNYEYLQECFPEIFSKKVPLPVSFEPWKINQMGVWKKSLS